MRRTHYFWLAIIAITASNLAIERDIPRGFFQRIDPQAAIFERLCDDVANIFAGNVCAAQFRHRIIAVADENPLVKCFGLLGCNHLINAVVVCSADNPRKTRLGRVNKFIEQNPPQTFVRTAVARKQRAFDNFRQISQAKNWAIKIRHKWRKRRPLVLSKIIAPKIVHGNLDLKSEVKNQKSKYQKACLTPYAQKHRRRTRMGSILQV